jgi:hypothetical protein
MSLPLELGSDGSQSVYHCPSYIPQKQPPIMLEKGVFEEVSLLY